MKQKQEDEGNEKQTHEIDVPEDVISENEACDGYHTDMSSKIKIHRKRSHHSESAEYQQTVIKGIELTPKDADKGLTYMDKKNSNNSVPDLDGIADGGDCSSQEKVRGPIARKLTFGHEVMDTPTKGTKITYDT